MTAVVKIPSNDTGLSYAEEDSPGVLPVTPVWYPLEPNSYSDFGGSLKTVARNPINASRQRSKGVITDLDAQGGFESDVTLENLKDILQGFFLADLRYKDKLTVTSVSGGNTLNVASGGANYAAGDLVWFHDPENDTNNGIKKVASSTGTTIVISGGGLTNDASLTGAHVRRIGFEFSAGDAKLEDNGGSAFPSLTTTTKTLTQLELNAGEWVFVGGDLAAQHFFTQTSGFYARVRSVAANAMVFDKTDATIADDDGTDTSAGGTGQTIRIFWGDTLKNEQDSLIVKRTYQLERTLGQPDDASSDTQSEYVVGAFPNQVEFNFKTADKLTANLSFTAQDYETRSAAVGIKSGTRPTLEDAEGVNTSSDVPRVWLAEVSDTDSLPDRLFAHAQDFTLTLNNNVSQDKAIGSLGSIGATPGTFEVMVKGSVYFADVAALAAVRANADITLDIHIWKDNSGISWDMPLGAIAVDALGVDQDKAIVLPLTFDAARGKGVDTDIDHTLLMTFWPYLPDIAND